MKTKGFTLIELLVVIAIIGMLAGIIIVNVNSARVKSRDARRKADLESIRSAIEMYADANGKYPPTNPDQIRSDNAAWTVANFQVSLYISVIPKDPLNSGVNLYGYGTANTNSEFKLCADLEADSKSELNDGGTLANSNNKYEIGNNLTIVNVCTP